MIKVEGLTKKYGTFTAVDDVSFVCQPGRVTGFLGPNGAGKTTTMRVMVGLTPASHGQVTIGGHLYHDLPNPGRHVGVLLDAGAQHAGRTGREILTIGAQTMGLPESRVDEMLELVSLSPTEAKRRLRNYSLGMKQRLGIAHALLGDPSVLILDEPANGLDPAGIRWMRGLLKGYADRGGTVLLSSHLLNEVELIADEMILIGHGRIVAQGDKKSLLSMDTNVELARHLPRQRQARADPRGGGLRGQRGGRRPPRLVRAGRRRPRRRRAPDRPDRPALRGRRPRGPLPRAHLRHPARRPHRRSARHDRHRHRTHDARPRRARPQVPMSRLAKVEFRKSLDTRAGRWFTFSIVALCLVVVTIYAFVAPDRTRTTSTCSASPEPCSGPSCPILIIMLVTAEASSAHRPGDLHAGAAALARRDRQVHRRRGAGGGGDDHRRADGRDRHPARHPRRQLARLVARRATWSSTGSCCPT